MNQCATHPDQQAMIYCAYDNKSYCSKCISNHNGHSLMSIEQYSQLGYQDTEHQSKYCRLKAISKVLTQLKSKLGLMMRTIIDRVNGQIKECKMAAKGKLIKSKQAKSTTSKYMELCDSLSKSIREMVESDLKVKENANQEDMSKSTLALQYFSTKLNELSLLHPPNEEISINTIRFTNH